MNSPNAHPRIKRYSAKGVPGLVMRNLNFRTGSIISIYRNDQCGIKSDCAWTVKCETHGRSIECGVLGHAQTYKADPGGWCDGCEKVLGANA